jgi:hypothetical protein
LRLQFAAKLGRCGNGIADPIPTAIGVGASGTIYFSSDLENAIYKITKK